jgi:Uma2 family endonuclease
MSTRRATYADIEGLPEDTLGQIVDGDLIATPRPGIPHQLTVSCLLGEIAGAFDLRRGGPGGWWFLYGVELYFGGDVLVPDLAGWRRERMPRIPDVPGFELAPDWVCEVLSPSTETVDRVRKTRIYARRQVGHFWIINPVGKSLEVYRLAGDTWNLVSTHEANDKVRAEPFDAVELDLAALWLETRAP